MFSAAGGARWRRPRGSASTGTRNSGWRRRWPGWWPRPSRPRFAGDPHPARWPDPGPALREIRRLARLAEAEARRLAREARGAGASWEQVAQLAGLEDAAVAFDWAAGPPYSAYAHAVSWTCTSCAGHVADYGPYSGEREEGHAAGCARVDRERAAHAAAWGNE